MNRFRSVAVGVLCALCVVVHAQTGLAGKWEGKTGSGRPIVLDLKVKGQQLTGTLTLAQSPAEISEGKVDGKTFSFTVTTDGRTVTCSGRLVDDRVELIVEGVADPLTLKRVK